MKELLVETNKEYAKGGNNSYRMDILSKRIQFVVQCYTNEKIMMGGTGHKINIETGKLVY